MQEKSAVACSPKTSKTNGRLTGATEAETAGVFSADGGEAGAPVAWKGCRFPGSRSVLLPKDGGEAHWGQ